MGDRAGSLPNYATINGKVSSSPVANGMASPSGSSTVSFSHTLPDFSKYSMPGVSLLLYFYLPKSLDVCPSHPSADDCGWVIDS